MANILHHIAYLLISPTEIMTFWRTEASVCLLFAGATALGIWEIFSQRMNS